MLWPNVWFCSICFQQILCCTVFIVENYLKWQNCKHMIILLNYYVTTQLFSMTAVLMIHKCESKVFMPKAWCYEVTQCVLAQICSKSAAIGKTCMLLNIAEFAWFRVRFYESLEKLTNCSMSHSFPEQPINCLIFLNPVSFCLDNRKKLNLQFIWKNKDTRVFLIYFNLRLCTFHVHTGKLITQEAFNRKGFVKTFQIV